MIEIFTGIIEEVGKLSEIKKDRDLYTLKVSCKKVLENIKKGDSIATNGVCLTVTELGDDFYKAEVMVETINSTNFKNLKPLDNLNLERALSPNKRLDGHIVQGHIDGIGEIINILNSGNEIIYKIKFESDNFKYIVPKGSIALDGISLTVSKVYKNYFEVSIIPTTISETNLKYKKIGDKINIETDIIGRYIYSFVNKKNKSKITREFLIENGF
ncbi:MULTISPECIES: riboflavin synthase [Peptoniphilus]|uniref:riboflavin synthase n=1 Tax=Peptoniphilus TaxID=162289 RepID=UPI0029014D26|nr:MULTISPECIES: riboflavin synthase [Peptoniphilus]MBS6611125.1 riboflavin synthase [Peptoniphilus harei]MDU1044075.1 riboflavin synthase [Peptoniphilus rhinitidis]MDU2115942.1 riboflavin synthase [Peptoniphilus lacydonensis]MDU5275277.1 riboflavin synthase [Peptoniphilus lacydonensis]MDU5377649.1 riboflavin synthase [Peptoniphilus lacydonensis]